MPLLVALFVVVVLLGAVLAGYAHLAGRLARLERANDLLLDLVSTQMTLGPADAARLGLAADDLRRGAPGASGGTGQPAGQPLATPRTPPA